MRYIYKHKRKCVQIVERESKPHEIGRPSGAWAPVAVGEVPRDGVEPHEGPEVEALYVAAMEPLRWGRAAETCALQNVSPSLGVKKSYPYTSP